MKRFRVSMMATVGLLLIAGVAAAQVGQLDLPADQAGDEEGIERSFDPLGPPPWADGGDDDGEGPPWTREGNEGWVPGLNPGPPPWADGGDDDGEGPPWTNGDDDE